MFETLDKLEAIEVAIGNVKSLMTFLMRYFSDNEPHPNLLAYQYKVNADLFMVIFDIVISQCKAIESLYDDLCDLERIYKGETV